MKALFSALIISFGLVIWVSFTESKLPPKATPTASQNPNPRSEDKGGAAKGETTKIYPDVRVAELKEQIIEQGQKFVDATTPSTNELVINVRMKHKEPRCRKLLESWGVKESEIQEILGIIRDKERELLHKRHQMYTKGISGVKDYELDKITATGVTNFRIEQLLGPSRAIELAQLEQVIESERRKSASKRVSD